MAVEFEPTSVNPDIKPLQNSSQLHSQVCIQLGLCSQDNLLEAYPHLSAAPIYDILHDEAIVHPPEDELFWNHKAISGSDLELADKGLNATSTISEHEAKGSIKGTVGHTIGELTSELFRVSMEEKQVSDILPRYRGIDSSSPEVADEVFIIRQIAQKNAEKYRKLLPWDVPYLASDTWRELRELYLFKNASHKGKTIIEGLQYNANWVHDFWTSSELGVFEQNLFKIIERKTQDRFGVELFSKEGLLPIEWDPRFTRNIEEPSTILAEFGKYRMLVRLQNDFAFPGGLGIDLKFGGKPESFMRPANRVQALLYSHAVSHKNYSKNTVAEVSPNGAMFLLHWFDTQSDTLNSYYIDATVYPSEYVQIIDKLCELTGVWNAHYKELRNIKKLRTWGIVVPFLEYTD